MHPWRLDAEVLRPRDKAYKEPGRVCMSIASDDAKAIEVASKLVRDVGYDPVLIGGMEKGKYLMPGTELSGERGAEEIGEIAVRLESRRWLADAQAGKAKCKT